VPPQLFPVRDSGLSASHQRVVGDLTRDLPAHC
jgi:hypothetical protein